MLPFLPILLIGVAVAVIGGIIVYTIIKKITLGRLREILAAHQRKKGIRIVAAKIKKTYKEGNYTTADVGLMDEQGKTQTIRVRSEAGKSVFVYKGKTLI